MNLELPVLFESRSGILFVTLTAPDGYNDLRPALVRDVAQALCAANADAGCRAIVLRAKGAHFCRGVALDAVVRDGRPDPLLIGAIAECFLAIVRAPKPVIACVEGRVTGGGVGLVAACDLVLAAPHAIFMLPEAVVGMIPALIAPLLLRRMAPGRVRAMALGTRPLPAAEARDFGLVDVVASADAIEEALSQQLQRVLRSSPSALAEAKRYLDSLAAPDLEEQLRAAVPRLLKWLDDEEIARLASGEAPSWFQRYERPAGAPSHQVPVAHACHHVAEG